MKNPPCSINERGIVQNRFIVDVNVVYAIVIALTIIFRVIAVERL